MDAPNRKFEIRICQGTACFVMGAADLLEIVDEIPADWAPYFDVSCAPCLEFCDKRRHLGSMPFVSVDGKPYADMTREKLYRLMKSLVESARNPVVKSDFA